jgi:hypothetical protein
VNRIAQKAMKVTIAYAIARKKSTMKCGIASSHLTSHIQRLRSASSRPSTATG